MPKIDLPDIHQQGLESSIGDVAVKIEEARRFQEAQRNAAENVGVSPDEAAKALHMATVLREAVPSTKEDYESARRRFAARMAVNPAQSPAVRDLLADRALSRLVADSPKEWADLGAISRIAESAAHGWIAERQQRAAEALIEGAAGAKPQQGTPRAWRGGGVAMDERDPFNVYRGFTDANLRREWAIDLAEDHRNLAGRPQNPVLQQIAESESIGDAVTTAISNPLQGILAPIVQSMAGQAGTLGAGFAASAINPVLAAGIMSAGSFSAEYGAKLVEQLQAKGVDLTDPQAILDATSDTEFATAAAKVAMRRAMGVASVDALSMGLASRTMKPVSAIMRASRKLPSKVKQPIVGTLRHARPYEDMVSQAVVQSGLGAAGEALGSFMIGETPGVGDMVLEALSELATAAPEVVMARSKLRQVALDGARRAAEAADRRERAKALVSGQQTTELGQRSPETYDQFIQNAAAETPLEAVALNPQDAGAFQQALLEASPMAAEQWERAAATGGDIVLPLSEVSRIAREAPEVAEGILSEGRFGTDSMSFSEAQRFAEENEINLDAAVSEAVDSVVADAARRREINDQARAAMKPLEDQLLAAGRSVDEVRQASAVMQSILKNFAEMEGMTPEEYARTTPLPTISNEQQTDAAGFQQGARGEYDPAANVIRLFKADESTFVHEMSHFWLKNLIDRVRAARLGSSAKLTAGQQRMSDLLMEFAKWAKAPGSEGSIFDFLDAWGKLDVDGQRAFHEKFAQGFERYLLEGKAPTENLASVFARFAAWLKECYRSVMHELPEISPEVAALYDRLFVSEEAVADARAQYDDGVYADLVKANLSEADFRFFEDARALSAATATAELNAAMSRDAVIGHNRRERERRGLEEAYQTMLREETDALWAEPEFKALGAFTKRGAIGKDGKTHWYRFDPESLGVLSQENATWVRKKNFHRVPKGKDGSPAGNYEVVSPIPVAAGMEFDTPNALVEAMRRADESRDALTELAEDAARQRFLERYGEVPDEAGLGRLAAKATQNDFALDAIASVVAAAKKVGNPRELKAAVKSYAAQAVSRMQFRREVQVRTKQGMNVTRMRTVSAASFRAAARRAARRAQRAFAEQNLIVLAQSKQAELIQSALAQEIESAKERVQKFDDAMRSALRSKTIDNAYAVQVQNIAARLGFPRSKLREKEPTLEKFVKSHPDVSAAYGQLTRAALDVATNGGDWMQLTFEDIQSLHGFILDLAKKGRMTKRSDRESKQAQAASTLGKMAKTAEESAKNRGREKLPARNTAVTWWENTSGNVRGFFFSHMRAATLFRILDGGTQGFFTKTLGWRANDCADHEKQLQQTYAQKLMDAVQPFVGRMGEKLGRIAGIEYRRENALLAILNWGNDGNRDRLMKGNHVTDQDIRALCRMFTAEELQKLNDVWAQFEGLRKVSGEMLRRVDGMEPDWADPTPFTVTSSDGVEVRMTGGYIPIKFDPELSNRARYLDYQSMLDEQKRNGNLSAQTARTYTKARVEEVEEGMPLQLSFRTVLDGVTEVIHDVSWREFIDDLNRLQRGATVLDSDGKPVKIAGLDDIVKDYFGIEGVRVINSWKQAICMNGPERGSVGDKYAAMIRRGVSLSSLGFNFTSALMQITGLIPAMTRVGAGNLLFGVQEMALHPMQTFREIAQISEFMRRRADTQIREIDEVRNIVGGCPAWRVAIDKAAYGMMTSVQTFVDSATWLGAFRDAQSKGMSTLEARRYADQTVRDTQGSGMVSDRSEIENMNGLGQLFLSFYSYMGTAYNLGAGDLLGESDTKKRMAKLATVFVAAPCIEAIIREAIRGGDDDDDEEKSAGQMAADAVRFVVGESAGFMLGTVFFGREIASAVGGAFSGETIYSYRGPSGLRWFSDITNLMTQIQQGDADMGLLKAIVDSLSVFGVPSGQVKRLLEGLQAMSEGDTSNPLSLIFGYKR